MLLDSQVRNPCAPSLHSRVHSRCQVLELVVKIVLVVASVVLRPFAAGASNSTTEMIRLIFAALCAAGALAMAFASMRYLPFHNLVVNRIACAVHCVLVWTTLVLALHLALPTPAAAEAVDEKTLNDSRILAVVYFIGIPVRAD